MQVQNKGLPKHKFKLLCKIISSRSCFDSTDNTFRLSNRGIADRLGVSGRTVDRLMSTMKAQDLVRRVTTITGSELMLNPVFIPSKPRSTYWFSKALYYLGYHHKAVSWYYLCWDLGHLVDPKTGEMLFEKSAFDCLDKDLILATRNRRQKVCYNVIGSSAYNTNFKLHKEEKENE